MHRKSLVDSCRGRRKALLRQIDNVQAEVGAERRLKRGGKERWLFSEESDGCVCGKGHQETLVG